MSPYTEFSLVSESFQIWDGNLSSGSGSYCLFVIDSCYSSGVVGSCPVLITSRCKDSSLHLPDFLLVLGFPVVLYSLFEFFVLKDVVLLLSTYFQSVYRETPKCTGLSHDLLTSIQIWKLTCVKFAHTLSNYF